MMTPRESRRIFWMVRLLAAVGLTTIIVLLGLVGRQISSIRTERVKLQEEQERLYQTSQEIRHRSDQARLEIIAILDANVPAGESTAAEGLAEMVNHLVASTNHPFTSDALQQLDTVTDRLSEFVRRAVAWRARYDAAWQDFREQRTVGHVRELITDMRGAVETLEGRARLREAMQFRRWRAANGEEAGLLAQTILAEQDRKQNRLADGLQRELVEIEGHVEELGGEEQSDNFPNLKDNEITPALDRLSHLLDQVMESQPETGLLSKEAIERLTTALFGQGYTHDQAHQTIHIGTGGLYSLRRDILLLRSEREKLSREGSTLSPEIDALVGVFLQAAQAQSASLTDQVEQSLASNWRRMMIAGVSSSACFVWLAWLISRAIQGQVGAIERAKLEAESGRQAAQLLIQERKRAEEELRTSEEHLRLAAQVTGVGTYEHDLVTDKLFYSPRMQAMYGVDENEQAPRKAFSERLVPEDRAGFVAAVARSRNPGSGGRFEHEHHVKRPDGSLRWMYSQALTWFDGEGLERRAVRVVGAVTDITERKRAEETTRRLANIVESSNDAIISETLDGIVTSWNRAAEHIFGYTAAEMIGRSMSILLPPDRATEERDILDHIVEGDEVYHLETRRVRKDGVQIDVVATVSPIKDAQGRIVGASKIGRDITRHKRAEFELEQTHNQLLAASRQAGMAEFATGVLHNVGNVLNSVNVASTCLSDSLRKSKSANLSKVVALMGQHEADLGAFFTHDPKGKQVPGYLAQLADHLAGEHATALKELGELHKNIEHIKSIITVQQNSANGSRSPEALQLTDLVEDALKMNVNGLERSGIYVLKEFAEIPPVMLEKHKVLQILVNLVRNAMQACAASDGQEKRLTIRVSEEAGRARITVADNGSGILPENLPRIFAHGFTTKKDGHGFGLHSAALAAQELGGALTVHSDGPGKGAAFTLELPCQAQENSNE